MVGPRRPLAVNRKRLNVLRKQKRYYSGKKKRHTLKTQILVNLKDGQIIALAFANGKKHDFRLFKESRTHVLPEILLEADTGYLGLANLHANSILPKKRSKKHPLTKQNRRENRTVSSQRIFVEHTIRFLEPIPKLCAHSLIAYFASYFVGFPCRATAR